VVEAMNVDFVQCLHKSSDTASPPDCAIARKSSTPKIGSKLNGAARSAELPFCITLQAMISREEQVLAEAEIAKRLLAARDEERLQLYGEAYDRIYAMWLSREPDTLDFGATPDLIPTLVEQTGVGKRVLEIGCGTGLLAIALRDAGRVVTAVDVSQVALDRAAQRAQRLDRLDLLRVEGVALPFADGDFDFAYSVEVVEHLHESDARAHFTEVARVLRRGASYWFVTPSRHASSTAAKRFGVGIDADADVHLKEWTHRELRPALRASGFRRIRVLLASHGPRRHLAIPNSAAASLERIPGLPRTRFGYVLGVDQCVVRATT
jgi:SAM-dependent methyltransferase